MMRWTWPQPDGGHIAWDSADRAAWFYFYRADMREWIFFTDARTFRERYSHPVLLGGLQGFCGSWQALGTGAIRYIWDLLPAHK